MSLVVVEQLYKLYKKRPRKTVKNDVALAQQSYSVNNPYFERPATARVHAAVQEWYTQALNELNDAQNIPDGLDPFMWTRLCDLRHKKINSELAVKDEALQMDEIKAFHQRRIEDDERLRLDIRDLEVALEKYTISNFFIPLSTI